MKRKNGFFCDIVPIVPIPLRNRQEYSYLSDDAVPTRSLVSIPFGPRTVRGIVTACVPVAEATVTGGRFKNIRAVIRESALTEGQLSLAEAVSRDCFTSMGRTLRHFLPSPVRERRKAESTEEAKAPFRTTKEERLLMKALEDSEPSLPAFLRSDMTTAVRVAAAWKRARKDKEQLLILVPETPSVPLLERTLSGIFGAERVAALESRRSAGAITSAWERIRGGKADVIVGTRQALFAPYRKLSLVLVLDEGDVLGYKQWDMSPRYDARRVAETLATLHGARTLFSGPIPGLDMRKRISDGSVTRLPDTSPRGKATAGIVNMREERWKKNRSVISETVRAAVAEALGRKRKAILVASRGGLDSFSVCETCKSVPRCPNCDRALRSTRDGHFRCSSCSYRTTSFPRCEKCGSLAFRNVGSGTEKIEKELTREFPEARIVRLDEDALRKDPNLRPERLPEAFGTADIVIGTPSVLGIPHLPDTALVAIMDTDSFLSLPDFRGDERFLLMASRATELLSDADGGTVLFQTFHPERVFFEDIAKGNVERPLGKAALDREALGYPPYRAMLRIVFRDPDEGKAETMANDALERLVTAVEDLKDVGVSGPVKPLVPKTRGRYGRILILSSPPDTPLPETVTNILVSLPGNPGFEPDPLSML